MDMLPVADFDRFRQAVSDLPMKRASEKYQKTDLICPRFLLFSDSGLDVYYVPFHHLNRNAHVVLMGLTPGWTQMEEAFRAARRGIEQGLEGEALFHHIAATGSFSGPIRKNLVSMLDGIGLNECLSIPSCDDLFDIQKPGQHLAHFTSAVSAAIFRDGENYRGYGPRLLEAPRLRQWLFDKLAPELASTPRAIVIPFGEVAGEVVAFLHQQGLLDSSRCLVGCPHPSGANGHRMGQFKRGQQSWRDRLAAWFGDHA